MEFLWSVLRDYTVCIFTCVCFLVFLGRNSLASRRTMKLFMLATISILFVVAGEIGERAYAALAMPTSWRVIYSVLSYTFRPAVPFFIALIPLGEDRKLIETVTAIPLLLNVIVLGTAFFSDIVFSYSADNHFIRGPLGFFPFFVGGFYVLILLIYGFIPISRGEYNETILCTTIVVCTAVCILIEISQDTTGILAAACSVAVIFYYTYFVINKYSHDALTNALLRSRMYQDVENFRGDAAFIIFDINGLKHINDTEGHVAGDNILTTFSKAALKQLHPGTKFYRIGGDEFAIIYKNADATRVSILLSKLKAETARLPFGFSAGYAFFDGEQEFDSAYARADAMLYDNKYNFWSDYQKEHPGFKHR